MVNQERSSYVIENNKICIYLYRLFFDKQAVLAAAQKMTGNYYVEIKSLDSERAGVYLEPKNDQSVTTGSLEGDAKNFCNEVLDQQVRLDLERRYGKLRELIVRQAFSPITLDELSKELNKDDVLE